MVGSCKALSWSSASTWRPPACGQEVWSFCTGHEKPPEDRVRKGSGEAQPPDVRPRECSHRGDQSGRSRRARVLLASQRLDLDGTASWASPSPTRLCSQKAPGSCEAWDTLGTCPRAAHSVLTALPELPWLLPFSHVHFGVRLSGSLVRIPLGLISSPRQFVFLSRTAFQRNEPPTWSGSPQQEGGFGNVGKFRLSPCGGGCSWHQGRRPGSC